MTASAQSPLHAATVPTSLGLALVALSARGVRALLLGDDGDALRSELLAQLPPDSVQFVPPESDPRFSATAAAIERGAAGDLELDVEGTEFQRRVWDALRAIPVGGTRSYSEIAEVIGAPRSVRAVARACGANRHAVLIPCHRVLRRDGGISGYRWSVARKRALLDRERATPAGPSPSAQGDASSQGDMSS